MSEITETTLDSVIAKLSEYQMNRLLLKQHEAEDERLKAEIESLLANHADHLENGVVVHNFKIQRIAGSYKSLNEKRLLQWITTEQLNSCKEEKQRKPYIKITAKDE